MGLRQEGEAISSIFEYIGISIQRESRHPLIAKLVAGILTPPTLLIARLVVRISPEKISKIYRESIFLLRAG